MLAYLDCNATTPIEPAVAEAVIHYMTSEFGNAGSRTHALGAEAKRAVVRAREQVASLVASEPEDVIFTSGATESDNLALLGLAPWAEGEGHRHIISSAIEHKAVLEPLEVLEKRGFTVDLLPVGPSGAVDPDDLARALRPDTAAVAIMHVNNETGVAQPLDAIADVLGDHPAYLVVDAAQGFGKDLQTLRNQRIDLMAISAHKIYGPKGVGALVARRRGYRRPPLTALVHGGGQERGIRPGTQPVPLIVGLGLASELAEAHHTDRLASVNQTRRIVVEGLSHLEPVVHGNQDLMLPHTLNLSIPGVDGEAAMVALKDLAAVSNGSACTSSSREPSHVLVAMGLPQEQIDGALRISWCHMTEEPDMASIAERLAAIRR